MTSNHSNRLTRKKKKTNNNLSKVQKKWSTRASRITKQLKQSRSEKKKNNWSHVSNEKYKVKIMPCYLWSIKKRERFSLLNICYQPEQSQPSLKKARYTHTYTCNFVCGWGERSKSAFTCFYIYMQNTSFYFLKKGLVMPMAQTSHVANPPLCTHHCGDTQATSALGVWFCFIVFSRLPMEIFPSACTTLFANGRLSWLSPLKIGF